MLSNPRIILSLALAVMASTFTPALNAEEKPVKVYILSGQSNMVGIGQFSGRSRGMHEIARDIELSTYPGTYDASVDYDAEQAEKVVEFEHFQAVSKGKLPEEGVNVMRGYLQVPETGIYTFSPGWRDSLYNIMIIDGKEAHRKEPGEENASSSAIKLEAGKKTPFKIIYLSNEGNPTGWYRRSDPPGTLQTVVLKDGKFPYLVDEDGNFVPRDDVWYKGVVAAKGNQWLNYGCGAGKTSIGPELGFGHLVGNYHDEPVLLLKTSQGNRSLGWDFLPPGSERFEFTDGEGTTWVYAGYGETPSRWEKGTEPEKPEHNWYAGKQYDECFDAAKKVLANFDKEFPHWAGRGYEVAGFGWWQGHKDGGEKGDDQAGAHATRYEHNLTQLINTLRSEFNAPEAPFVVATCGFNGGEGWQPGSSADTIFKAQMAVSDPARHPEFDGTVMTVDTRPFYRPPEESPRNQSFHYHGNAETYMYVGEAMGRAMVRLKE